MKKRLSLTLAIIFCLSLAACGKEDSGQELTVFAAASLQETLTALGDAYTAANEGVNIVYNFDSSGTLKTQIQEGADADIFLSAGQKQMDQLDAAADPAVNTEGLDFVLTGSRIDLLENKVALVVSDKNAAAIRSYEDMAAALQEGSILLAMGNADVPVGQYTQKILNWFGLDEAALAQRGVITYASNVKEIVTQVREGAVDCGIVYQTDAYSAGLAAADTATAEMCGQVVYPAAVLKGSENTAPAKDFLAYLTTAEAAAVFEAVGFSMIK